MSNTITIQIESEELEKITIELTSEEVLSLYKTRKEQSAKIDELEKKLKDETNQKDYHYKQMQATTREIEEAGSLLSALGIPEKTEHENEYYRKQLTTVARIGIFLAKK